LPACVFGDVHGCSSQLEKLISQVKKSYPDVTFYSLGDLIDRGPNSSDVLNLCIQEDVKPILGNHESWLQTLLVDKVFDTLCLHESMGGKKTFKSFGVEISIPYKDMASNLIEKMTPAQKNFIEKMPAYRELLVDGKRYWLTHAGIAKNVVNKISYGQSLEENRFMMQSLLNDNIDIFLWPMPKIGENDGEDDNLYAFEDAVQIFGHTIVKKPVIKKHFIALDTGCGTYNPYALSCIILPTNEIIQVNKE
jgi:hypothetical protein